MYNQLIRSKIDYVCSVWNPYTRTAQSKLEKSPKKSLQIYLEIRHSKLHLLYCIT